MAKKVASETMAYCTSCRMDLNHVVVAQVADKIVKVQCLTCKKEHQYRPPKGTKEPSQSPKTKKASSGSSSVVERKNVGAEWASLMDAAKNVRKTKYNPRSPLEAGMVIDHAKFGDGVVTKIIFPNKAEVLFQDDVRILIHSL